MREHIATLCVSPLGKRAAQALRPQTDAGYVRRTLRQTTEMRRILEEEQRLPLVGIRDLGAVFDSIHRRGQPIEELEILEFRETLESASSLRTLILRRADIAPTVGELAEKIGDFEPVLGRFDLTVDRRGKILDEASPRLLELRQKIRSVESGIDERMRALIGQAAIRTVLREARAFYRNGRYVLPVKAESRGHIKGMIHDSSQSGNTVFVEPQETIEDGNRLADLRSQERREVSRILWQITRDMLDREAELRELLAILGEIDLIAAKAVDSLEGGLRPAEPDDGQVLLRDARHPLLLLYRRRSGDEDGSGVVPIDVRLGGDFHLLIVTGPNTGGKTVCLKTVGLLALMNQAGLHLPVGAGSRLPIFDHIGADIGDEQSLQQSLSTFSGHMSNITAILAAAGKSSLILLDELGAGTDPAEGAALGIGILDYLKERGSRVIITTHIGSLKTYAYRNPEANNACVEFDVDTLAPTYRLSIGQPGNSNAVTIARRIGMPSEVLERASQELGTSGDDTNELVHSLQKTLTEAERRNQEAEGLRAAARLAQEDSEQVRDELVRRRDILDREADVQVDVQLRAFRDALEPLLQELRHGPKSVQDTVERLELLLEEGLRATPLASKRDAYIRKLKKEDLVTIPKYRQRGRVKRISREKRTVSVVIGAMSLEVPFEEIAVPEYE